MAILTEERFEARLQRFRETLMEDFAALLAAALDYPEDEDQDQAEDEDEEGRIIAQDNVLIYEKEGFLGARSADWDIYGFEDMGGLLDAVCQKVEAYSPVEG